MYPCQVDRLKKKRIYKLNRFFYLPLLRSRGRFSSCDGGEVILARCHEIQTLLAAASVVKVYVIFNGGNKNFTIREFFEIVNLGLQDTPPVFHWSVIKAPTDTGHTLYHTRVNKLLVKHFVCVLKSSVTMEDWLCIGIKTCCLIKGFKYEYIVVAIAYLVCNNASVIKVKYCRKIQVLSYSRQKYMRAIFC